MRILVVEDDLDIQESIAKGLKAACFAVDTASDGEKGHYLARLNDYDAIVLDYMLPKKNGFEICRDLRKSGKKMPILMLSVCANTDDKVTLLEAGVDDYMTKPFSQNELLARIRALLRRPAISCLEIMSIGDITIDSKRQTVMCGDQSIYLTRKEFSLLEYLARNQGYVLSRGMIMEHVWDQDSDPFSNTIEAHIGNLRKKLGRSGQRVIHTVPGRGYKAEVY
jgi:DNA-binding response OmpR family regulator